MKAPSKGPKPSTKPKKASNSQNGKRSRNGTNCGAESLQTSLDHKLVQQNSLKLLKFGELATKIVVSYYYKGSAQLNAIKHSDHLQESYHDSALKLVKKGILNKNGFIFSLTDEGRELATNFVNYFREQRTTA